MSKHSNFLALIPLLLGSVALVEPVPAHAGFIFDLSVSSSFFTGSGSIDFATQSGSSVADLSAFSFHVSTGAGSPQDYGLGNVATVSWTIDNSSNLSDFLLTTDLISFGTTQSAVLLTTSTAFHQGLCSSSSFLDSQTCTAGVVPNTSTGVLTARSVNVPEPAAIALFGFGLAALGFMLRRARAAQSRHRSADDTVPVGLPHPGRRFALWARGLVLGKLQKKGAAPEGPTG